MPDQFRSEVQVKIDSRAVAGPVLAERRIELDPESQAVLVTELLLSDPHIHKIAEMAGAITAPGESQETVIDGLRAAIGLEGGESDIYVLSAIQNDPKASLQLLKTSLAALEEISREIVDNGATTEIQALEQKIHDAEAKLQDADRLRGRTDAAARSGGGQEDQDPRYLALKSEMEALSKRRAELVATQLQNAQTHPEIFSPLSEPAEPSERSGPNRVALHGFILVIALAIGTMLAVGVNVLRPTVNSASRLRTITGLPVLGCVGPNQSPRFQHDQIRSRVAFLTAIAGLAIAFVGLIVLELSGVNLHHLSI